MAGARNSLTWTESDAIAEAVSAESCHIVLDSSPPDYVEKISRYLESSVGYNRQNKVADEPAGAESDSGDSLFITQTPAPEAERTRRRHRSLRSDPISPRDIEGSESESDASSSDSHEVSKSVQERRRRRRPRLPEYSFSFISGRKGNPKSSVLPRQQNISLHNYTMGGFFKCVKEQWLLNYETGDDEKSPTADVDSEDISPLSEEEEERSEDEDIKVVERKCFLAPSKAKSQQSWSSQLKQEEKTRKGGNARRETSQGRERERDLVEKLRNGGKGANGKNTKRCLPRGDKKISLQQRTREEELLKDSDAAVHEPHKPQRSPRLCPQKHRKASTAATEPQTDVLLDVSHTENEHDSPDLFESLPDLHSDTNNESEPKVKKRKTKGGHHESIEEEDGNGHSQEEPKGLHAGTSVDMEVEETARLSEDNRAEPPASQTTDELEFNEGNCFENSLHESSVVRPEEGDVPDSKQKKKKRKKSAAGNVSQDTDGNLESDARVEDSGFSESCNAENGGKKKTTKRKRSDEEEEQLQSRADAELLSDGAEIKKKKKKRKKEEKVVVAGECEEETESNRTLDLPPVSTEQLEEFRNGLENTTAHEETLESSCVKRKTPKKKKKPSSSDDAGQDREEVVDVSFSKEAVTLEESTDMSLKKKKKKKKKKSISEEVDISHTPEESEKVECEDDAQQTKEGLEADAELATKKKKKKKKANSEEVDISNTPEENETAEDNTQKIKEDLQDQNSEKKKKKKTKSETSSRNIFEDNVAQSDDSVSVRKKEKKKKRTASFLAADAEENSVQTHGEQNCLDFETELAGNLGESVDRVREKKKKKRKRTVSEELDGVEKDHEHEPNETCESALPESADTGVKMKKRKKKSKVEACSVIQESPPTATEAGNQTLDDDNLIEGNSELHLQESKKKKKKERNKQSSVPNIVSSSPALSEMSVLTSDTSFSHSMMKNKQKKVMRTLHYPSEDFLMDY